MAQCQNKSVVDEANSFIFRCVEACIQCHSFRGKYLWEHPEDLGEVHGEHPASIWQWSGQRPFGADKCNYIWERKQTTFFMVPPGFSGDGGVSLPEKVFIKFGGILTATRKKIRSCQ